VINFDTTLGQQLLDISIGQPVTQVPPHRNHDHIRREPETGEARPRHWYSGGMTTHQPSLPDLVGTLLGLLYGSLTSATMIALRCATHHTLIPFGPALIAGAFTGLLLPLG
jgi:hypothetical protein